jgi:hypothetical protein
MIMLAARAIEPVSAFSFIFDFWMHPARYYIIERPAAGSMQADHWLF